jgi:hypothetical protein
MFLKEKMFRRISGIHYVIRRRDLLVAGVDALEVADGAGQLVHALVAPGVEHRAVGPETALLDQVCKKGRGSGQKIWPEKRPSWHVREANEWL